METASVVRAPAPGALRYEERPGVPAWAAVVVIVAWGAPFGAGAIWLATVLVGVVCAICFPFLPIVYTLWTNGRRRIRIDEAFLTVGRREPVPLEAVDGFALLKGVQLRSLHADLWWPTPTRAQSLGMAVAAAIGSWGTLGSASGLSGLRGRFVRYGVACPFWARCGLVVHAPFLPVRRVRWRTPATMPDLWLIGTRRPDEFLDALRGACEARRATLGREAPGEQGS